MPVLPFLFLAGFLRGRRHGFLYPALSALLVDVTPERRRGSAVGIFSSVFLLGNAVGAMAFGYVAHGARVSRDVERAHRCSCSSASCRASGLARRAARDR